MPCYKPGRGRQAPNRTVTYYGHIQIAAGKVPPLPPNYKDFPLPCGKCTGCKLEYSRQWAVRLMHEAELHDKVCFITPTYRDEALRFLTTDHAHATTRARAKIEPATLVRRDLQLFTKRLNEDVRRRSTKGIKYYACGEYGERTNRPHYHLAIYGEDFADDRQFWKHSPSGHKLWRSSRLERLWPHGDCDIGELTFESAAYIARYIMKKITGTKAHDHYKRVDRNGYEYYLTPEFNVMSRGGRTGKGIAAEWFELYKDDVFPHDHVISRGFPAKPPRYYDKLLEALAPHELAIIKEKRETGAARAAHDNTPARLEARETVALAKLNQNKRSLE